MAKNKTKQAKFKPVVFKVQKREFKNAIDNLVKHIGGYMTVGGILNGVKIHVENDYMEMIASDGFTILKSTVLLDAPVKGEADTIISGLHLSKMKLVNGYNSRQRKISILDYLEITINQDNTYIKDDINGITYTIPRIYGQYPDVDQFFKKSVKDSFKVCLSPELIERFKKTTDRGLVFVFDKSKPLDPIILEVPSENSQKTQYTGLVMPIVINGENKE